MDSTRSTASWHPAHRPNSDAALDPVANDRKPPSDDKPVQPPLPEPSFDVVAQDDLTSQHVDAWASQDTGEENWLEEASLDITSEPAKEKALEAADLAGDDPLIPAVIEAPLSNDGMTPKEPDWTGTGEENWLEEDPHEATGEPDESHAPETAGTTGDHPNTESAENEAPLSNDVKTPGELDWTGSGEENWLEEGPPEATGEPGEAQAAQASETTGDHPITESAEKEAPSSSDANPPKEPESTGADIDGEDGWFLNQQDSSDPFDFMPPLDRTNSFPAVPPLDPPRATHARSLSRTQAQDVMADSGNGDDTMLERDELVPEDDTATSRYEEGVPLLSQDSAADNASKEANAGSRVANAFADEGDDFFNNIGESTSPAEEPAFTPHPLDRKSTMQAMGVGDSLSVTRAPALPDTPEVNEEVGAADVNRQEAAVSSDGQPGDGPGGSEAVPSPANAMAEASTGDDEAALAAKWSEAFADDDLDEELLLDDNDVEPKEMDPAELFGSDDEGFLDDLDEQPPAPIAPSVAPAAEPVATASPTSTQDRYAPHTPLTSGHPQMPAVNQYAPPAPATYQAPPAAQPPAAAPFGAPYGAPQQRPEPVKAQSFADKAKGGYSSPYDLPMDVVKPKKRASMQQLRTTTVNGPSPPGPPLRSASMVHQMPPPSAGVPPVEQGIGSGLATGPEPPAQSLKPKEAFFEDLPITTRPRPSPRPSRTSSPAAVPPPGAPTGPPMTHPPPMQGSFAPPPPTATYQPAPPQVSAAGPSPGLAPSPEMIRSTSGGVPALVQPEKVNPYGPAPAQTLTTPPASAPANRYSPAPAQQTHLNGTVPTAPPSRYSPAPPASRQPSGNYAAPPSSAPPAPVLPHQPRTSSPLAHFSTNGEGHMDRRTSLPHEMRLNRVPSLPPTREVDEENEQAPPKTSHSAGSQPTAAESRYSPAPQPGPRQTPPPLSYVPGQAMLSPPKRSPLKRSSYAPLSSQPAGTAENEFAPPPRSYSQSPGTMQRMASSSYAPTGEPSRRPSSAHGPTSPISSPPAAVPYRPSHRARAPSLTLNMIPPTDGRENDPLQRWKGSPVITWGVGGTVLTSFPKSVPRYGINQTAPMIVRTPGELKVNHVKDLMPLEDRLAKFPGPLKGKAKKKETAAWLSAGIESLAARTPDLTYMQDPSLEDKRANERLLLWKILHVFIENDGVLEGTPAVQKAVRNVLVPGLDEQNMEDASSFNAGAPAGSFHQQGVTGSQADAVDPAGIELMRKHLMVGDREKAAWAAVDKRLWGHAMLIANTVSPDLYKQVAQEFVRKEVNYQGYSNESVAALYKVLSGSHEECVDELVPVHARAGLQLMSTTTTGGPSKDALDGLDKWRETLCLILGNRSPDDARALIALGELLSNYERAEAAHICFMFARQASVFGGLDDPRANFVLVGADHKRQGDHLFKDTEALLLSEVYEYGMCLTGGVHATAPHLAAYKLQLATILAEYGQQSRALEYCAAIGTAVNAQTKRSPYYSPALEHAVHDFIGRLKQAPKEDSSSWIPKPSMNKVSDTVWSKFNKFVSGDDADASGAGAHGENGAESGPFAGIPSGSPSVSRVPSTSNFDIYGASTMGYPGQAPAAPPATTYAATPAQPASRSASRYAPAPQQTAAPPNPYEAASSPYTPRTSSELARGPHPYESSRPSTGHQQQYNPTLASQPMSQPTQSSAAAAYGVMAEQSYPAQPSAPSYQPQAPATPPGSGYTPLGVQDLGSAFKPLDEPSAATSVPAGGQPSEGYTAPSYGFEPPSLTPAPEELAAADGSVEGQGASTGGYEPPSYGYEPPSYEADPETTAGDGVELAKPKKGMMDDDEDDIPALKASGKTKSEKDRENEEMVRRVAEQEGKSALQV